MISKSIFKAGKLLKISLDYNEQTNIINSIKIEGDFFLHPEEGRELLEKALAQVKLEKQILIEKINFAISANSLEVHGFTSDQLAEAILHALQR